MGRTTFLLAKDKADDRKRLREEAKDAAAEAAEQASWAGWGGLIGSVGLPMLVAAISGPIGWAAAAGWAAVGSYAGQHAGKELAKTSVAGHAERDTKVDKGKFWKGDTEEVQAEIDEMELSNTEIYQGALVSGAMSAGMHLGGEGLKAMGAKAAEYLPQGMQDQIAILAGKGEGIEKGYEALAESKEGFKDIFTKKSMWGESMGGFKPTDDSWVGSARNRRYNKKLFAGQTSPDSLQMSINAQAEKLSVPSKTAIGQSETLQSWSGEGGWETTGTLESPQTILADTQTEFRPLGGRKLGSIADPQALQKELGWGAPIGQRAQMTQPGARTLQGRMNLDPSGEAGRIGANISQGITDNAKWSARNREAMDLYESLSDTTSGRQGYIQQKGTQQRDELKRQLTGMQTGNYLDPNTYFAGQGDPSKIPPSNPMVDPYREGATDMTLQPPTQNLSYDTAISEQKGLDALQAQNPGMYDYLQMTYPEAPTSQYQQLMDYESMMGNWRQNKPKLNPNATPLPFG